MAKIEKLTPEQEALIPVVRDEWIGHGLSTEPADRPTAEEGVKLAYEAAGLTPPATILWFDSPKAGAVAASFVADGKDPLDPNNVSEPTKVRAQLNEAMWGQHESGWLSFYDYFSRIGLEEEVKPLLGTTMIAKSSGWWWSFTDVAILTERPRLLKRDPLHRLHAEEGMAIQYPDGWGLYCWHGFRVPEWVIMQPTPELIAAETNVEIRRCAIESYGWTNFIDHAGLKQVGPSEADPGNPGCTISLYDVPEDIWGESIRLLIGTNGTIERDGTRRVYGLTVPPEFGIPSDAAGWTYGLSGQEYRSMARRT